MALTRAQLLSGNNLNGVTLPGQPQGVIAGTGISISTTGIISVNASTVTGLVKLNNTLGYNSYVWPGADGAAGEFLQTDGAGNLTWATAQGFAVVTVQSGAPSPADVGELWFDCSTGTLNVYQNCVGTPSPNWFNVAQPGLPVLPANTSAAPPFASGTGTQADPYDCTVTTTGSGTTVQIIQTVTVTGLAPFQFVPIIDLNAVANGGRFSFTNNYADASGDLTFDIVFSDNPPSLPGTPFTAAVKVGYGSAYIEAAVNVVVALSTTAGSISGTPQTGSTLTYTTGVASGGTGPYTYAWIWQDDLGATLQTGGATYVIQGADVGRTISVVLTATDSSLATATATTAPTAIVTVAPFPSGVWNPTGSLTTIPGGITGTYNGLGPISSTGCIQFSVNGGPYGQGPTPITSGQTLAARWITSTACGDAATGTNLTGTLTDGTYENSYAVTVNRVPSPAVTITPSSNVPLNGTVSSTSSGVLAGLTATAYVTLGTGSTGSNIRVSTNGVSWTTLSGVPGAFLAITNGQTLYVEQTVGPIINTSPGYTAVLAIGDSTGTGGGAGTYATVVYTATTIATATFPNTTFTPSTGPTASPENTNVGALQGTAQSVPWADGSTNLTSTGNLEFKIGAGGTYGQSSTPVNPGDTVFLRWNPTAALAAADAGTLSGNLTNTTYTNTYSLTVSKKPTAYSWGDLTNQATSTPYLSSSITISGINCPAQLTCTPDLTNPLSSVQASINGGVLTTIPTSGAGLIINPANSAGTAASSVQIQGTTGSTTSTTYGVTTQIGYGAATTNNLWTIATSAAVPSIDTPTITSPTGSPPAEVNPGLNSPAGIPLIADAYSPQNGAGAQANSTWEVYEAGLVPPRTSAIQSVVTLGNNAATVSPTNQYVYLTTALNGNDAVAGLTPLYTSVTITFNPPLSGTSITMKWLSSLIQYYSVNGGPNVAGTSANTVQTVNLGAGPITTLALGNFAGSPDGSAVFTAQQSELYFVKVDGTSVVANTTVLNLTNNTNLSHMVAGDSVQEFGGGNDATGDILLVNTGGSGLEVYTTSGTWTVGASVEDTTAAQITASAPTTDPPDPLVYTATSGSPYSVTAAPFTTFTIPQADLSTASTYYGRVKYSDGTIDSNYSNWSSFLTSVSFNPVTPGAPANGGYLSGQIKIGSTIYNLIVAPTRGDTSGPNPSGSLQGQFGGTSPGTLLWKTSDSGDTVPADNAYYGLPTTTSLSSGTYPAFNWCVSNSTGPNAGTFNALNTTGTGIGGFNDWYIPSVYELMIIYYYLKPGTTLNSGGGSNPYAVAPQPVSTNYTLTNPAQTTADGTLGRANFRTGGNQAFTAGEYNSATQDIWAGLSQRSNPIDFADGSQPSRFKAGGVGQYTRAIRRVAA